MTDQKQNLKHKSKGGKASAKGKAQLVRYKGDIVTAAYAAECEKMHVSSFMTAYRKGRFSKQVDSVVKHS